MCHWGGIHWFPRDELGNGMHRFSLESLSQLQVIPDSKASALAAGAAWHLWSHLILFLLSHKSPRLQFPGWSLWDFYCHQSSRGTSPGNSFLLAKPFYSRAWVKRQTCVTQSINYVIKILYSALTFHSVVIDGEIIQLATELTFWTAFTGFSSYLYLVLTIF